MTEPLVCIGSHSSRFCHYLVKTRGSHQYSQLDVWDGKKVWKGNIGEVSISLGGRRYGSPSDVPKILQHHSAMTDYYHLLSRPSPVAKLRKNRNQRRVKTHFVCGERVLGAKRKLQNSKLKAPEGLSTSN
ncbi:hypothetical protein OUZ56_023276 [Daphnia magna]|uniref:Uncharacterized protein n=1 Tax=Daphnia magna TaxID=35525 RepID=A0ABR0AZF7_9CRUS|nr:hypothetical protein OUZ56_023276 [Daphnia magna]